MGLCHTFSRGITQDFGDSGHRACSNIEYLQHRGEFSGAQLITVTALTACAHRSPAEVINMASPE
jgi:hypothetical protein